MSTHTTLLTFAFTAVLLLTPTVVSAQEKIAFESQRDGNHEIYIMNADGTNQVRLTFNTVFDGDAAFSHGGEKIAFTSTRNGNYEIYVMNTDGSSQTRLTNSPGFDGHPAFSPDGTRIAFASDRSGHLAIWVMNADGSSPIELMDGFGGTEPEFSPDGTKILFSGTGGSGADSEIWLMNDDGTGRNNLSREFNSDDTSPAFNADGTKIVYFRDPHGPGGDTAEIFTMEIDGSHKLPVTSSNGTDFQPSYSVDGTRIVFTSLANGNAEIYAMNADGTNPINLTNHFGSDRAAVWGAANSAPVLSNVGAMTPINEGEVTTLTGQITDANANDSFVLNVAWGDGQTQTINYPAGTTSFAITHLYADDPSNVELPTADFIINYSISDHRFGTDSGSTNVTVLNVSPILSNLVVAPSTIPAGGTVTLTGEYTDPGYHGSPTDEQLQVFIMWGDGQNTGVVTNGIPGGINETHQYVAAGNYTITVHAVDNDMGLTVATLAVVVTASPPATPTGLNVQSVSVNRIELAWTDASNNETGFAIERCSAKHACSNFVEIARVGANATTYADTTVSANTQYFYRMRAFNSGGESSYTNVVSAKTPRK